jgi:hypothetical protein
MAYQQQIYIPVSQQMMAKVLAKKPMVRGSRDSVLQATLYNVHQNQTKN